MAFVKLFSHFGIRQEKTDVQATALSCFENT